MKDIKAIRGKFYIQRLIEEGEHEHQDFKYAISDARKIARSLSAFANNDGGRLLIGVKDNGRIVGIPNEEDIYMIEHAAERYCSPAQPTEISAYVCEGGAVVLQVSIPKAFSRPVYCLEEGNTPVAYFRVKDENIVAHPLMVEAWKMQAEGGNGGVLQDSDLRFLRHLDEVETTTIEEYMLACHVSAKTASRTIARLLSVGLIEMVHRSNGFVIRRAVDEPEQKEK